MLNTYTLELIRFSFNLLLVAIDCDGNLQNNATCEKPKTAPRKLGILKKKKFYNLQINFFL